MPCFCERKQVRGSAAFHRDFWLDLGEPTDGIAIVHSLLKQAQRIDWQLIEPMSDIPHCTDINGNVTFGCLRHQAMQRTAKAARSAAFRFCLQREDNHAGN
jgi:NDP-sugar pyrophosphorylase family protein